MKKILYIITAIAIIGMAFTGCQKEELSSNEQQVSQNDEVKQQKDNKIWAAVYTNIPSDIPQKGKINVLWSNDLGSITCSKEVNFNLEDYPNIDGRVDVIGCAIPWSQATNVSVTVTIPIVIPGEITRKAIGRWSGSTSQGAYITIPSYSIFRY